MPKKKVGKMAIFGPKPWVNPFGKRSIFRFFELFVFMAVFGPKHFGKMSIVRLVEFPVLKA